MKIGEQATAWAVRRSSNWHHGELGLASAYERCLNLNAGRQRSDAKPQLLWSCGVNANNGFRLIVWSGQNFMVKSYKNLYGKLCSLENLEAAFRKARKGKRSRWYVKGFEADYTVNILQLQKELKNLTYEPRPLKTFVIHDPKTRVISASHFRDRIVHHALCNILEPIFEKARTPRFEGLIDLRRKHRETASPSETQKTITWSSAIF